jgi:hypothetical protein
MGLHNSIVVLLSDWKAYHPIPWSGTYTWWTHIWIYQSFTDLTVTSLKWLVLLGAMKSQHRRPLKVLSFFDVIKGKQKPFWTRWTRWFEPFLESQSRNQASILEKNDRGDGKVLGGPSARIHIHRAGHFFVTTWGSTGSTWSDRSRKGYTFLGTQELDYPAESTWKYSASSWICIRQMLGRWNR